MSVFQALAELETKNKAGALCTLILSKGSTPRHTGSKMLVYPDGSIIGTVGGGEMENRVIAEARKAILDGKPRLLEYQMTDPARGDPGVCGGQVEVFVEPVQPKPILVVIGTGHVGKAVAHLAHWLGFWVVANDDRPEFCTPQAVPDADEYIPTTNDRAAGTIGNHPLDLPGADHPGGECGCRGAAGAAGYPSRLYWRDRLATPLGDGPQAIARDGCSGRKTQASALADRPGIERRDA